MPDVGDDFRIPITGGANELSQASEAARFKGAPSKDARDAQTCSLGRLRLSAATTVRPCAKTRERQISPAHQRPARPCLLLGSFSSQLKRRTKWPRPQFAIWSLLSQGATPRSRRRELQCTCARIHRIAARTSTNAKTLIGLADAPGRFAEPRRWPIGTRLVW
jgi:hypothetical protein